MPMPSAAPLAFPTDYVAEFPAGAGVPFGPAWCRGAGIVPDIAANAAIPMAPPLNTLQFLGATNIPALSPITGTIDGVASSYVGVRAQNDGQYMRRWQIDASAFTTDQTGSWLTSGTPTDYDVKFDVSSGTPAAGSSATGTWLAFNAAAAYEWGVAASASLGRPNTLVGTMSFRLRSSGAIIATCAVNITATY